MIREAELIKALNLTPILPSENHMLPIRVSDMNRPGLQLAGYWDFFAHERPQILGLVEVSYLQALDPDTRRRRLEQFVSYDLPCIVICRHL